MIQIEKCSVSQSNNINSVCQPAVKINRCTANPVNEERKKKKGVMKTMQPKPVSGYITRLS